MPFLETAKNFSSTKRNNHIWAKYMAMIQKEEIIGCSLPIIIPKTNFHKLQSKNCIFKMELKRVLGYYEN